MGAKRWLAAIGAFGCGLLLAGPRAQQAQAPQEIFRTGVDLVRLDVSVLDDKRQPIRGLTAADFVVSENGRLQKVVAVSEVDAMANDPKPSAWMRYATRDVANNDIADQLGDGRAVAIVLDDHSIPENAVEMSVATREAARYVINTLGPSDLAAVVYPVSAGRTEDFTHDRSKLLEAVDKFKGHQPDLFSLQSPVASGREGDMQRYSPTLGRDPCFQLQPVVPTLRTVTSRLATVPNRRKTLIFVSVGLPMAFAPGRTRCEGLLYEELRRTLREAQRANVNIHGIDPGGPRGFEEVLQEARVVNGRMTRPADSFTAHVSTEVRHDFLETLAQQTGGRAVFGTDVIESGIDEIFAETASYYLVGYESSNPEPDGRFRRVEVKIQGRQAVVRTRSGHWAPDKDSAVAADRERAPASSDLSLAGLLPAQRLPLRAVVHPVARMEAAAGRGTASSAVDVDLAAVLTVRLPPLLRSAAETLTVVRTVYDANGRPRPPIKEVTTRALEPAAGDEFRYDVLSRFSLAPGRYQVRFNATSALASASGSVIVDLDVPDLARSGIILSGVVLGAEAGDNRDDPLRAIVPIVPTTSRDYTGSDRVTAFARIFQGGSAPVAPVTVVATLVGADAEETVSIPAETIPAEAFATGRSAEYKTGLPLSRLRPGLHLLSVTASLEGGRSVRRDVVFRVR